MMGYSIGPTTKNMSKDIDFCHLQEKYQTNLEKNIGYWTRCFKTAFKKVNHKVAEVTGEFLGNNIANKIPKPVEEIIIPPEKREDILNELRQVS